VSLFVVNQYDLRLMTEMTALTTVQRVDALLGGLQTVRTSLRVLLVVHSLTAATRLADVLPAFQDRRVQICWVQTDTSAFEAGVAEFMDNQWPRLSWEQACALEFDIAVTAGLGDNLHELRSPILRLAHGNGYNKYWNQGIRESGNQGIREASSGCRRRRSWMEAG
jgi:hypothetical protein